MDYEQKYKETLERAKKLQETCDSTAVVGWCEYIFPELKESEDSEDERISKEITQFLKQNNGWNKEWFAWLEKQGEQPSAIRWYDVSLIPQEMEELLVEWDSEDATWHEIAFYHADTKTFWNGTSQVENVTRWCYIIDLLEKQEAQILANSAKTCKDEQKPFDYENSYCQENCKGFQETGRCFADGECKAKREAEQKPAWSEEDEEHYNACLNYFEEIKPDSVYYKDYL